MILFLILVSAVVPWVLGHLDLSVSEECNTTNKYCQPEQIHIAFGENLNDITVTWSTMKDTVESHIQYGEKETDNTVTGKKKLFIDGGTAKRQQWIHNVALKDLKYNTTYVYKAGSKYGWSDKFSFTTPPEGENNKVSAIIYGDMGLENDHSSENVYEEITNNRYDMVIHNGDFAYDLGSGNATVGDKFMNKIQKIAANIPYMTSPGNHEGAYNFSNYKNRFSMPGNTESMYYSFNIGPVHFIAINTEAYSGPRDNPRPVLAATLDDSDGGLGRAPTKAEVQTVYNFIKADLEEASKKENREKHPWIIMYGHRPMYCSNKYDGCPSGSGDKNPFAIRKGIFGGFAIEPLLKEYGVDLAIWAHEHSYERLFPVYDVKVYNGSYDKPYYNPRAPVHIVSGSAGNAESEDPFQKPSPGWSAFHSSDYGYMRMFVHNHTHLYLEAMSTNHVSAEAASPLGEGDKARKIDEMWLIKNTHGPYDI